MPLEIETLKRGGRPLLRKFATKWSRFHAKKRPMTWSINPVAAAALAIIVAASPAGAQQRKTPPDPREKAEEAFREGAQIILRGLQLFLRSVPQYEAPEVLDNGDIIIRRKRRDPRPEDKKAPDRGDTRT